MNINNIKSPYSDKNMDAVYRKAYTDTVIWIRNELNKLSDEYIDNRNNTHCMNTKTSSCDECRADIKLEVRLQTIHEILKKIGGDIQ